MASIHKNIPIAADPDDVWDALRDFGALHKRLVPVSGTRHLRKRDLILNDYLPQIEVDPQTYEVRADGQLLTCEPASVLPLAQRYFLF